MDNWRLYYPVGIAIDMWEQKWIMGPSISTDRLCHRDDHQEPLEKMSQALQQLRGVESSTMDAEEG